jgi:hypothetical protein
VESITSAPSGAPPCPQSRELSPALRCLLEPFIPPGSRCLNVSQDLGLALGPWLLHHGCVHVEEAGSQVTALPHETGSGSRSRPRPSYAACSGPVACSSSPPRTPTTGGIGPTGRPPAPTIRCPALSAPAPCGACCSRLVQPRRCRRPGRSVPSRPALGWTPRAGAFLEPLPGRRAVLPLAARVARRSVRHHG